MNSLAFEKAHYRIANDRIINLIKDSHDWENTEGFIADGVICPDEYERQSVRILCILAESYGYDGCKVTHIESQPDEDVLGLTSGTVKAPRKLATLLWLLHRSFEQGSKVKWNDMPWLFRINEQNTMDLQNALKKAAWINVKKASRREGTAMDDNEVFAHAVKNQVILHEQIEAAIPHLIIVCGKIVFRALHQMKMFGPRVTPGRQWQAQCTDSGLRVLEVSHPRSWWGYEKLYRNFEGIYAQMA